MTNRVRVQNALQHLGWEALIAEQQRSPRKLALEAAGSGVGVDGQEKHGDSRLTKTLFHPPRQSRSSYDATQKMLHNG